jgi:hypothetical protein
MTQTVPAAPDLDRWQFWTATDGTNAQCSCGF